MIAIWQVTSSGLSSRAVLVQALLGKHGASERVAICCGHNSVWGCMLQCAGKPSTVVRIEALAFWH